MCISVIASGAEGSGVVQDAIVFHRIVEFLQFDCERRTVQVDLDFYVENRTTHDVEISFLHRGAVNAVSRTNQWRNYWTSMSDNSLCKRTLAFHDKWRLSPDCALLVPSPNGICEYALSPAIPDLLVGAQDDEWRPYSVFSLGPFRPKHGFCRVSFSIASQTYDYLLGARSTIVVEGGEIVMRKIGLEDIPATGDDPDYGRFRETFTTLQQLWSHTAPPRRYEVVLWADEPEQLPTLPAVPCEMTELKSGREGLDARTIWLATPAADSFEMSGTVAAGNFVLCPS